MIVSIKKKKITEFGLSTDAMFVKTNRQDRIHLIKAAQNKQTERITSGHADSKIDKKNNLFSCLKNLVKQRNKHGY